MDETAASSERSVRVTNPQGMHLRPATEFARVAQGTGCRVRVRCGDVEGDGASVLELVMMAAGPGATLHIAADGEGAAEAVAALVALVERDFDA